MKTYLTKIDLNEGQEPTAAEVKAEQDLLDSLTVSPVEAKPRVVQKRHKAPKKKAPPKKAVPRVGTIDGLSQYMKQLSHIPLFTADQESEKAKELESFCVETWSIILNHPGMLEVLVQSSDDLEAETKDKLAKLTGSYKKI